MIVEFDMTADTVKIFVHTGNVFEAAIHSGRCSVHRDLIGLAKTRARIFIVVDDLSKTNRQVGQDLSLRVDPSVCCVL